MNKKAIIVVIIIAAIAIPVGIYTVSPLFISTTVNEPPPTSSVTDLQKFQEFMSTNSEEERVEKGQQMATEEKNAILRGAAQINGNTVNENMTEAAATLGQMSLAMGKFIGVNDGIHNAEGLAKVIQLDDGSMILRLENFKATNTLSHDTYTQRVLDRAQNQGLIERVKGEPPALGQFSPVYNIITERGKKLLQNHQLLY